MKQSADRAKPSGHLVIGSSGEVNAFGPVKDFGVHITRSPDGPITRFPIARFPWNVVHACELARAVLRLVEGQLAVGMRPHLLTPGGFGSAQTFFHEHKREPVRPVSLLQAWSHVREWRKLLTESSVESFADVIHAHSFSAGMAAVRASSGVVYQLRQTVEEIATRNGNCDANSWLARSFRVAEQFVLTHAAAVVVNHEARRDACIARGTSPEQVFCIPDPLDSELFESTPDREWLSKFAQADAETVVFAIPSFSAGELWQARDAIQRWMRVVAIVHQSCREVKFLFIAGPQWSEEMRQLASACKLTPFVKVLDPQWQGRALESADVVICDGEHGQMAKELMLNNPGFPILPAVETMARGRALLAADVRPHRELTSDGRGCLWLRAGDIEDIAHRAIFLAQHPRFRQALAASGREHCLATRSSEAVAAQYDAVYRLALARRKGGDASTPKPQLIPVQAAS